MLRQANELGALLLTSDKDFGDLVHRLDRVHEGVVLLRLSGLPDRSKAESVVEAIRDHADEMIGAFSVISPGQIRIRRSPKA